MVPRPHRARGRAGDTVNTNVLRLAGRTLALVEAGTPPAELDESLDTVAYTDFDGALTSPFSAHPHEDPATGEWHAVTYTPLQPDRVWHVVITREGSVSRQLSVPVPDGPSIHECTLTKRFAVASICLSPCSGHGVGLHRWNPQHPARVPREGSAGDIIWCDVDPAFCSM